MARRVAFFFCCKSSGDNGGRCFLFEHAACPYFKLLQLSVPDGLDAAFGYQEAALQAISILQGLYGFIVVDYSFPGLMLYKGIARAAVSAAARAACLLELAS